jgi:hypothetical protein
MFKRSRIVAAATTAAIAAVASPAAAAPTWLSPELAGKADYASESQVAVAADGTAIVVWMSLGDLGAASRRPGGAWRAEPLPAEPSRDAYTLRMAADAKGRALVVWPDSGASHTLRASVRGADGKWAPSIELASSTVTLASPEVAVNASGQALVAWVDAGQVKARAGRLGGAWGPIKPLGAGTAPSVAINRAGQGIAVWAGQVGRVHAFQMSAAGSWSGPLLLSDPVTGDGCDWSTGVTLDDSGNAAAAWARGEPVVSPPACVGKLAQVAHGSAAGVWQVPSTVSDPAQGAAAIAVAGSGSGHAVVAWDALNGVQAVRRAPGGGWSSRAPLGDATSSGPTAVMDRQGRAVVTWTAHVITSVIQARLSAPAAGWGAVQTVSLATGQADFLDLAGDGAGNAVAIWTRIPSSEHEVWSSRLDSTGPALTGLSVPAAGVAGSPVALRGAFADGWSGLDGAPAWTFGDGQTRRGASVSHAWTVPGTYTVGVRQTDRVGNATAATRRIAIAAPRLSITRAALNARFVRSRTRGRPALSLTGRLAGARPASLIARLRGPLRPKGAVAAVRLPAMSVPAGAFRSRVRLPKRLARRLLPGDFRLVLAGTAGGATVPAARRTVHVRAPAEGVVVTKRISTTRKGPNYARVSKAGKLWATFKFSAKGRPSRKLRAVWFAPGSRRPVGSFTVRAPNAFSYWGERDGLAAGRWRCVLKAGDKVVAAVSVRVG